MAAQPSGTDTYYVPEQSKLAICMATSVAVLILGAASGLNGLTFNPEGASWGMLWIGLLAFVICSGQAPGQVVARSYPSIELRRFCLNFHVRMISSRSVVARSSGGNLS